MVSGKSLIQFGFPGSRVSLKDWCSLEATNFLSCSTPSAIECKKSREQRCNEQAIKIFISRGFQEKEAFVDDIWEFQVSMVFSMLMYGGNCVIWERISG
ncbi:uncharacterized protein LOC111920130 isoform X3 [Lactuca sativa]|uniref:uncharacterized protein LOC111920130 isoform X3 n=1 Tax=Lactuca sativa TaxID=4236 RepID=UPI0022B031FD|nr:uncharacterized protein LOC111920130 isoform X3 [Lactuca sativa]